MTHETTATRDGEVLDDLIEQICSAVQGGKEIDIAQIAAACPDHAERLKQFHSMISEMNQVDHSLTGWKGPGADERQVEIGFQLGDFRIIRLIARGGMGAVYEAEQVSMRRRVALKVLPLASLVDRRALQRFKNEVIAVATVEHPNIVPVYAVGEERGIHYYAMKMIEGQSLAAVIRELRARADREEKLGGDALLQAVSSVSDREGGDSHAMRDQTREENSSAPLPPTRGRERGEGANGGTDYDHEHEQLFRNPENPVHPVVHSGPSRTLKPDAGKVTRRGVGEEETVARGKSRTVRRVGDETYFRNLARLIQQAAEALQHAHDHGIVHRDIKPGNLLLDSHGSIFVTDFGLARIETGPGVTMTGDVLGTLRYMSPEQVEGNRQIVDHRTDVYSLGATLYELLTLQPIWTSDEKAHLIRQITHEEPLRPQRLNPLIPPDLETIVLRAVSKNASDRYDTAEALAYDLRAWLDLKPIVARQPSVIQRITKWARRNPAVIRSTVAILIVVISSLILGIIGLASSNRTISKRELEKQEALNQLKIQHDRAINAEKSAEARANELELVSSFQTAMLEQIKLNEAGYHLSADIRSKFEEAIKSDFANETDLNGEIADFARLWNRVNAADVARAFIIRTILDPAVLAIDRQFEDQPLVSAQLRQALSTRYAALGKHDIATGLQKAALDTRLQLLSGEHEDTLFSMVRMGERLMVVNNLDESEKYFREALHTSRRVLPDDHRVTLDAIGGLGLICYYKNNSDEAERLSREAHDGYRRAFGDEDKDTLIALNNLALALQQKGEMEEAEKCFREVMETQRRVFGEDGGQWVPTAYNLIFNLISQRKNLEEAEQLARERIEFYERATGYDFVPTIAALGQLGDVLQAAGKLGDAEKCFCEQLEISRRTKGDDSPLAIEALDGLGRALTEQGKLDEAEVIWRELVNTVRRKSGDGHRNTIVSMCNLAEVVQLQERHREVVEMLAPIAESSAVEVVGSEPNRNPLLQLRLGISRARLKEFVLAEASLLEAQSIFNGTDSNRTVLSRESAKALVDLYTDWNSAEPNKGFDAKASEWAKKLETLPSGAAENK